MLYMHACVHWAGPMDENFGVCLSALLVRHLMQNGKHVVTFLQKKMPPR